MGRQDRNGRVRVDTVISIGIDTYSEYRQNRSEIFFVLPEQSCYARPLVPGARQPARLLRQLWLPSRASSAQGRLARQVWFSCSSPLSLLCGNEDLSAALPNLTCCARFYAQLHSQDGRVADEQGEGLRAQLSRVPCALHTPRPCARAWPWQWHRAADMHCAGVEAGAHVPDGRRAA